MPKLIVLNRGGNERTYECEVGSSVMEVIRANGDDDLLALCGGCRSCATCHVYVSSPFADRLPAVGEEESGLLEGSAYRNETSRLSCQLVMTDALDGLRVEIAPED